MIPHSETLLTSKAESRPECERHRALWTVIEISLRQGESMCAVVQLVQQIEQIC